MQILDTDRPLLLWGAERAFSFQLLAGMYRLGFDVTALVTDTKAQELISQTYPKCTEGLNVPADYEGLVIWAPERELFSNQKLSPKALEEIQHLISNATSQKKLLLLLSQNSKLQLPHGTLENPSCLTLFFPSLIGFGDENIFEKSLELYLKKGFVSSRLEGSFLSVFDAVSFVLSALKRKSPPPAIWVTGQPLSEAAMNKGLDAGADPTASRAWTKRLAKLIAIAPPYEYEKSLSSGDNSLPLAEDFFPTQLTPWERFFRDAYRNYISTPEGAQLLHFRPSKTP